MNDLNTFIKNHRDFIENVPDVLFISTHYYLLYNDYHLTKDTLVIVLNKTNVKNISTEKLTYTNNTRFIEVLMYRSQNDFLVRFEDCDTKRILDSKISLECEEGHERNVSYACQKIVELYQWYNLKTCFFNRSISTHNLKEELVYSVSSLEPLSTEENISTFSPINIPSASDLVTPNPQLQKE